MTFFAGIDAGSRAVKMVLLSDSGEMLGFGVCDQGVHQADLIQAEFSALLERHGLSRADMGGLVATGYARALVPDATGKVTEITCHARGVVHSLPGTRTIIEIGGQDSKAIRLSADGKVADFMMNDRCAAGTGRFLEMVAMRFGLDLEAFAALSREGSGVAPMPISSMCVVFAETEIIGLLASGAKPSAILHGVQHAIAGRVVSMLGAENGLEPVAFTGGVALIPGMHAALETRMKKPIHTLEHPQLTGALGAALIARDRFLKSNTNQSPIH